MCFFRSPKVSTSKWILRECQRGVQIVLQMPPSKRPKTCDGSGHLYRMGNWTGAKNPGKWERKWKWLHCLKNGRRKIWKKVAKIRPKSHFRVHFSHFDCHFSAISGLGPFSIFFPILLGILAPGPFPEGAKIKKIRDFERDWKFRARIKFSSEPPTAALFFLGKSRRRDWNFERD